MAGNTGEAGGRDGGVWRLAGWGAAAALLVLPLLVMQLTDEMDWDLGDFVFLGVLLAGTGIIFELAVRRTASIAYRAGVATALVSAFLLISMNAAVGIIGSEANPANLLFALVLAVAVVGSVVARFRPSGLARALVATASTQICVGIVAVAGGLGVEGARWPTDVLVLTTVFAALWLLSAWLFRQAARVENAVA